jgi:hypothetical protein
MMWTLVAKRLLRSWSTSMLMTEPLAYSQWLFSGLDELREQRTPNAITAGAGDGDRTRDFNLGKVGL